VIDTNLVFAPVEGLDEVRPAISTPVAGLEFAASFKNVINIKLQCLLCIQIENCVIFIAFSLTS
jgi:hypothetical protein